MPLPSRRMFESSHLYLFTPRLNDESEGKHYFSPRASGVFATLP